MQNCNHEEADVAWGCVVVHVQHALKQGGKTVRVRTADTDVVILVVVLQELIATQQLADIWMAFGMGKN